MAVAAPASAEKPRGGYYTPAPLAGFLAGWVGRAGPRLLEPSRGDGVILRELGAGAVGVVDSRLLGDLDAGGLDDLRRVWESLRDRRIAR